LVVNEQFNTDIEKYIVEHWQKQLNVPIDIEVVDSIPLMHNNKRRTIIED